MAEVGLLAFVLCFASLACITYGHDDSEREALNYDADNFVEGLRNSRSFVMFYAPWCGHCKNLFPTWNELAKIYNNADDNNVIIAKVDCTIYTALCADHDVVGFPTLKLFNIGGGEHKRYSGRRDLESLKNFIHDQVHGLGGTGTVVEGAGVDSPQEKKPTEDQGSGTGPLVLTLENFDEHVRKGYFFIKFFTPWCGHCKKLAPTWNDLAETFNQDNKVTIAKVDCTENKALCKQHGITGYPYLLWFQNGQKVEKYQGPRSHEAFKDYVALKLSEAGKGSSEKQTGATKVSAGESKVKDLTDDNFESHLSSTSVVFVKFFAPWCGHCKQLAPKWEELAEDLHSNSISVAKVDCTIYRSICENHQVRGYPTLKLFVNGKHVKDYKGVRNFEELRNFVKRETELHDEL